MTPDQGLKKQIELYRRMTGAERAQIGFELYDLAHEMVRYSIRDQRPERDEGRVREEVLRRFQLAERIP